MDTDPWPGPPEEEWSAQIRRRKIEQLEAECARLRARVAELEAMVAQPAAADPDLKMLLDGIEQLRLRLYPPLAPAVWPTDLRGQRITAAQRRLLEDQVYAWRHPADGTRVLTHAAIAERLGVSKARVGSLVARADYRHLRARERAQAESGTSQGNSARGPLP